MASDRRYIHRDLIKGLHKKARSLSETKLLEAIDDISRVMKENILNAEDTIESSGKTYYISNNGNDSNNGLTPETAWATVAPLEKLGADINAGDAVLFERGGMWRKPLGSCDRPAPLFTARKGVYYGAYGEGRKPILCGSERNFADEKLWEMTGQKNVYCCTLPFYNAGLLALDHSEELGLYDECIATKEVLGLNGFNGLSDMKKDCSYFNDMENKKLYFYSEKGNPGKRFDSIEICGRATIISNASAALIENFIFQYDGYGITGGPVMHVKSCIFRYMGGCMLYAANDCTVPCGNAVEIYGNVDDMSVENCWIYQMVDTAVTHQMWKYEGDCIQKNIRYTDNLIEYCHWSIEFNNPPAKDGAVRLVENFKHSYNVVNNGGNGWGSINFNRQDKAAVYNCFGCAKVIDGICEGNIFNTCAGGLYRMHLPGDRDIKYRNNINIQYKGNILGQYLGSFYDYDENAEALACEHSNQEDCIFIAI